MIDKTELINLLSNGAFHSGEAIGKHLGVTRAAVWKAVQELQTLGVELYSVRGKGYRLAQPMVLLNKDAIIGNIDGDAKALLGELIVNLDIDSTNIHLLELARAGQSSGSVCLAEHQSNGRGRRGRQWVSPLGANLYMSLLWEFPDGAARLSGLSLAVGVFLVKALECLGVEDAKIKWPNDIVWHGRKLAGILIEVSGETSGPCHVVCGIGLNINMPDVPSRNIDQSWADLKATGASILDRNQIAAVVIQHVLKAMKIYQDKGFGYFHPMWMEYDLTYERPVEIHLYNQVQKGTGKGVDERGMLLLDTDNGLQRYASGEVSLRFQDSIL